MNNCLESFHTLGAKLLQDVKHKFGEVYVHIPRIRRTVQVQDDHF